MQLKFIYTNPDGTVGIVGSAHLEDLQKQFGPKFTINSLRKMIHDRSIPAGATYKEMPIGWEPPKDRTFRNAWRGQATDESTPHTQESRLHVDMPAARQLHRDKLRRKRIAALAALDTEYMRADEANDQPEKRRVAMEKQRLRDIPADPRIDSAKTPDELLAVTI